MSVKPVENRRFRTYERKNEDKQNGHNQRLGIPLLTFLYSYKSFLRSCFSRLFPIGDFIRRLIRSYVASAVPMAGRTVELWAWRTYIPPLNSEKPRMLATLCFNGQHTVQHTVERSSK